MWNYIIFYHDTLMYVFIYFQKKVDEKSIDLSKVAFSNDVLELDVLPL